MPIYKKTRLDQLLGEVGLAPISRDGVALDIGASTGGFTDVLISRGAARVYAVDCRGQLHAKLRVNSKVIGLEGHGRWTARDWRSGDGHRC